MYRLWRGLTYWPRFYLHYRHRRKAGFVIGHALTSTRARMRKPDA